MRFSLVVATVGRTVEVKRFLESLDVQSHTDYELIVVDQNPDDRLLPVLREFDGRISLKYTRSSRGLSRARNVGIKLAAGDVVAFPDDDCWYPVDLLERVAKFFNGHPEYDGLSGRPGLPTGEAYQGWDNVPCKLTKTNFWQKGMSLAIFLSRRVIVATGSFDETLGVGSGTPWGSGEEADFLLSSLEKGFGIYYEPSILVLHPPLTSGYNRAERRKAVSYERGTGRVLRKHYTFSEVWKYFFLPLRSVVYSFLTVRPRRAMYVWAVLQGRLGGYMTAVKAKVK